MVRKRGSEPEPIEVRQLSADDLDRGVAKLHRRLDDIQKLKTDGVRWDAGRKRAVETEVRETIREVFGPRSPEFRDFEHFEIDKGGSFIGGSNEEYQRCFLDGIPPALELLQGLIARLEERKEDLAPLSGSAATTGSNGSSRRVFVVHGRDDAAKESAARFLAQLDLEPIILHEQPNGGRTIIEKFERYADVAFAVVLLTPDDLGASRDAPQEGKSRARQNVIFELGFFIGRLGRGRVCALHKGDTEILSDYQGVVYVAMDVGGGWKLALAREIREAGIAVDLNKAV
jgi:predicted nucleotide-binding protein